MGPERGDSLQAQIRAIDNQINTKRMLQKSIRSKNGWNEYAPDAGQQGGAQPAVLLACRSSVRFAVTGPCASRAVAAGGAAPKVIRRKDQIAAAAQKRQGVDGGRHGDAAVQEARLRDPVGRGSWRWLTITVRPRPTMISSLRSELQRNSLLARRVRWAHRRLNPTIWPDHSWEHRSHKAANRQEFRRNDKHRPVHEFRARRERGASPDGER